MRNQALLKWILIAAAVFSVVMTVVYLVRQKNYEQSFTVENLSQERGTLVKQDMKFLSRGHNFAHYAVSAISERADTVVTQYRVPANSRKLKALLWIYDAPRDVNLSTILDDETRAQHVAVMAYNIHDNFERNEQGAINSSAANLYNGLAQTRRNVEMQLQLLRKHQIIDSTQIFVAGQGVACTPMLGAVTDKAKGLKAIGLIDFARGMKKWQEIDKNGFATSYKFASDAVRTPPTLIEPKDSPGFNWPDGGQSLNGQPYNMANAAGLSETEILKNGLESAVSWVVGNDTLELPIKVDTTFTRVVKVGS